MKSLFFVDCDIQILVNKGNIKNYLTGFFSSFFSIKYLFIVNLLDEYTFAGRLYVVMELVKVCHQFKVSTVIEMLKLTPFLLL
jgi:hypothetical protein